MGKTTKGLILAFELLAGDNDHHCHNNSELPNKSLEPIGHKAASGSILCYEVNTYE